MALIFIIFLSYWNKSCDLMKLQCPHLDKHFQSQYNMVVISHAVILLFFFFNTCVHIHILWYVDVGVTF